MHKSAKEQKLKMHLQRCKLKTAQQERWEAVISWHTGVPWQRLVFHEKLSRLISLKRESHFIVVLNKEMFSSILSSVDISLVASEQAQVMA